jgi:cytochrome c biogenesis protein CcmG/thiol:disulfide interchange protein DsbE
MVSGLDTTRHLFNNYFWKNRKRVPVEMDHLMLETSENASGLGLEHKNKRRRRIIIFCAASLINLGLLALLLWLLLTPTQKAESDPLIGHTAPNFSLATLPSNGSNSELSLSNFKGKAVVLNFWASWCDPCKEELPLLESSWKQLQAQKKDVVFLGIDYRESNNDASSFLHLYDITYPSGVDADGLAANKYNVTSLPQTIFISSNGTVISRVARQLTAQALASNLQLIT